MGEKIKLDDLRDNNNALNVSFNNMLNEIRATTNNSFNKILNDIRAATKNEEKVLQLIKEKEEKELKLLTKKIVRDVICQVVKGSVKVANPLGLIIPKKKRGTNKNIGEVPDTDKKKRDTNEKIDQVPHTDNVHSKSSQKMNQKRPCEGENSKEGNRRNSKKPKRRNDGDPSLPENFKNSMQKMNGHDWVFVIEKSLTKTDRDGKQNRLAIPKYQVSNEFLREDEKDELERNKKEGIGVRMIEPCLEEIDLKLKKWPMGNTYSYALIGNWGKVLKKEENKLMRGTTVQLWAFRVGLELCFALVIKDEEKDSGACSNHNGASTSQNPNIASSSTSSTLTHKEKE